MKRTYCGAIVVPPQKTPRMPASQRSDLLGERFEQLRRGEEAAHLAMLQNGHGLIDDVLHVGAGLVELLVGDDLLHEARIEIDEVARAAAHVGEMLDGEAQAARAGRAHHQPVVVAREMLVGDLLAELGVIDLVIVPADALLGHAGRAAGFENVERLALELRRHPDLGLQIAQPFVLEVRELRDDVGEGLDFLRGIRTVFFAQSSQNGQPVSGEKCQ